jgi:hypothetical protein
MVPAASPRHAPENPWDLGHAETEEIQLALQEFGLHTDREAFRVMALRLGSPARVADLWIDEIPAEAAESTAPASAADPPEGTIEAPIVAAAWELWRRWAPDVDCAEVLAEEFDRDFESIAELLTCSPARLREAERRADRILAACCPPGRPVDQELFEAIWQNSYHDLAMWLRCLPRVLAEREQLEGAIRLCDRLALLFEARIFLSERAILLARAGRDTEARKQVRDNVRRWRRDPIVLKKACETLWAMGHSNEALLLYDEVLELTGCSRGPEE